MLSTWGQLIPLVIGSALVPVQIIITILLLRSKAGRVTAVAWVAGMTAVRLAQGLLFGVLLGAANSVDATKDGPGPVASTLLLVVAIIFYAKAAKQILKHPDEDAPPPKWMAGFESIAPGKAFLLGTGVIAIGAKPWVFTLAAITILGEAGLGQGTTIVAYLVFVLLAECLHLALVVIAYAMPGRAALVLDGIASFMERRSRAIVIALGLVFGTWFMLTAFKGLGIL